MNATCYLLAYDCPLFFSLYTSCVAEVHFSYSVSSTGCLFSLFTLPDSVTFQINTYMLFSSSSRSCGRLVGWGGGGLWICQLLSSWDYFSQTTVSSQASSAVMSHQTQWHHCFISFLNVCVCVVGAVWSLVSCWPARTPWLMRSRATGTDCHSCTKWCRKAAKPGTPHSFKNRSNEVVCLCSDERRYTAHTHTYVSTHVSTINIQNPNHLCTLGVCAYTSIMQPQVYVMSDDCE